MKKRMAWHANKIFLLAAVLTACAGKATTDLPVELAYALVLDTLTRGEGPDYMWTHARSAAIPADIPLVITTMSMTLKAVRMCTTTYISFQQVIWVRHGRNQR